MIKILIGENEAQVKEVISQLLRKEGYAVMEKAGEDNVIQIIKKDSAKDAVNIKDIVVELEDSLYNEKRGTLYKFILEMIERPLISHALERAEGNQLKAAKVLGINRNTMRAKIKKLGINPKAYKQ